MIRSSLAIVVGMAALFALVIGSHAMLAVLAPGTFGPKDPEVLPGVGWIVLVLVLGLLSAVMAGYLAARVAGRAELRHGIALAGIILALSVLQFTMVSPEPGQVEPPVWYSVGIAVVGMSGVIFGSGWRAARLRSS